MARRTIAKKNLYKPMLCYTICPGCGRVVSVYQNKKLFRHKTRFRDSTSPWCKFSGKKVEASNVKQWLSDE